MEGKYKGTSKGKEIKKGTFEKREIKKKIKQIM